MLRSSLHQKQAGFTLTELIITIVLGGIVAAMTTSILTLPINAYIDNARRATLTDVAESALKRMQRDIRRALPNSIRISADRQTLELIHTVAGGRYRSSYALDGTGDILDFTQNDTSVDVLGTIQNLDEVNLGSDRVVIYPLSTEGSNAYAGDNTSILNSVTTANHLNFAAKTFPRTSPQQRFFIIDSPITYHCDLSATAEKDKVLLRYDGYNINTTQPTPPSSGSAMQANYLASCSFSYHSGSSTRSALVTLEMVVTDEAGESIRLVHQVHVDNQP
ncbi:MAG: prepilin-type N-terminal cleavage/methylation domain-containing protein [Methylophaga sp.]|nr:prepilin-type N-terminal cleavage/methylation domain-containing protein [Methylophaga sp.]